MAKIWAVYEGKEPTYGGPWAMLPLADAIKLLKVDPKGFLSDPSTTPRFGDAGRDDRISGYKHIVVEVLSAEAKEAKWKAGFYRSPVRPEDAFNLLIEHAASSQLGPKNVRRVIMEPTTDSEGHDALRITVVLEPRAVEMLKGDATLNALIKIRGQLRDMHDARFPLVEYATEQELRQSARS